MPKRSTTVVLTGMDELKAKLTIIQDKLPNETAQEATLAAAELIAEAWRARIRAAPWKDSEGNFARSIEARKTVARRKNAAQATVARRWLSGVPRDEQPLWYGHRLEFGDSEIPARPTGRPAFDASHKQAQTKAQEIIVAELRKLVKEGSL
jgi:HK97 gp10 family phage protein